MAFYLFPSVMYHRLKDATRELSNKYDDDLAQPLQGAYKLYKLTTRQYFGFGILLQFISGTNANLARKQLSNLLENTIDSFKADHSRYDQVIAERERFDLSEFYWFKNLSLLSPLNSYLNFSPLFNALEDITEGFKRINSRVNMKLPLIKVVFKLPILKDIFTVNDDSKIIIRHNALKNLLHSLFNPVRIIDDTLSFLHTAAYRVLDIGSERNSLSSLPRAVAKGALGVFFGIIKIPVKTLKHIIDLPLNVVKTLIINPVEHFLNSIRDTYQNWDKEVLIATKKEFQNVKELRRTAKKRDDTSYSVMTKKIDDSPYVGITKKDLYSKYGTHPEQLIAIRASKEKIAQTSSLFSIVSVFNANQQAAKDVDEAVEQARAVLPVI